MSSIVSVVIAAQPGHGFATSRWTSRWGDTTLLGHVLDQVRAWPVAPGLVVLGADAEELLDAVDLDPFSVLIDPQWSDGELSSLQAALDYLERDDEVEAILIVSGDMPLIPAGTVEAMLAAYGTPRRPLVVVPKYRYARGRPLLIRREVWPRLLGLGGGSAVETVLASQGAPVADVWIDHLPPAVIARPEDRAGVAPRR
jgi:molybdenum cofactor cytidylyltransferase